MEAADSIAGSCSWTATSPSSLWTCRWSTPWPVGLTSGRRKSPCLAWKLHRWSMGAAAFMGRQTRPTDPVSWPALRWDWGHSGRRRSRLGRWTSRRCWGEGRWSCASLSLHCQPQSATCCLLIGCGKRWKEVLNKANSDDDPEQVYPLLQLVHFPAKPLVFFQNLHFNGCSQTAWFGPAVINWSAFQRRLLLCSEVLCNAMKWKCEWEDFSQWIDLISRVGKQKQMRVNSLSFTFFFSQFHIV